jgi:hypothetical protein
MRKQLGLLAAVMAVSGAWPAAFPQRALAQTPAPSSAARPTAKAAAPIDLTGTWVSIVSEDWRWRMVIPRKGDYSSVPLNDAGRRAADLWEPSRMAADGCKPFGAAAIMRVPGRLQVTWENDTTLRIDTDAGLQTRRLRFDAAAAPAAAATWQGHSRAEWERIVQPGGLGVSLQTAPARTGSLKVVTTQLRAGFLRRNGVPYSERTIVTEYFDRLSDGGHEWLTVITIVEDPMYLSQPFITSSHFKREPDASKWAPAPCEAARTASR